jgi:hypothetical protein
MGVFSTSKLGGARGALVAAALLAVLTIVQIFALTTLPYSKASLRSVKLEAALNPTDPLVLDGLNWRPDHYVRAASLQSVRDTVAEHCPALSGFALARCMSNLFATRFANGHPKREFFNRQHDPVGVFRAHLAGETGHCVSRSGMLALALLATGTPARVVQILGKDGMAGHNVTEVWEAASGWRVLDPSFAGLPESDDGRSSAVSLTQPPFPRWRPEPSLTPVPGVDQREALTTYAEHHLRGAAVIYPDPWLYTRVGSPGASWPFFGRFVIAGSRSLAVGWGQPLLQAGIAITLLGSVLLTARAIAVRLRAEKQPLASTGDPPIPASSPALEGS